MLQVCRDGYKETGSIATSTSGSALSEGSDRIDGRRKDRGEFFHRDIDERLEIAELQRDGIQTDHVSCIGEALGGFKFAFRVSDLRVMFALRFRLTHDGSLHLLPQAYILDLYDGDGALHDFVCRSMIHRRLVLICSCFERGSSIWDGDLRRDIPNAAGPLLQHAD